jgi:hypothetical protein
MKLARHAIRAALIASVGNRHAQVRNPMAEVILHFQRNVTGKTVLNQEGGKIDSLSRSRMIFQ